MSRDSVFVRFCRGSNSEQEYANDQNTRELWVGRCIFRIVWGQIQIFDLNADAFHILLPYSEPNTTNLLDWMLDSFKIGDTYYSDIEIYTTKPKGVKILSADQYFQLVQS